jgi:hypothetical protein
MFYVGRNSKTHCYMFRTHLIWIEKMTSDYIVQIWNFLLKHKYSQLLPADEIQELDGMYFRKAAIANALRHGCPVDSNLLLYPSMEECIEHAQHILLEHWTIGELKEMIRNGPFPIQHIQNTTPTMVYRKRITKEALRRLTSDHYSDNVHDIKYEPKRDPSAVVSFEIGDLTLDAHGRVVDFSSGNNQKITPISTGSDNKISPINNSKINRQSIEHSNQTHSISQTQLDNMCIHLNMQQGTYNLEKEPIRCFALTKIARCRSFFI